MNGIFLLLLMTQATSTLLRFRKTISVQASFSSVSRKHISHELSSFSYMQWACICRCKQEAQSWLLYLPKIIRRNSNGEKKDQTCLCMQTVVAWYNADSKFSCDRCIEALGYVDCFPLVKGWMTCRCRISTCYSWPKENIGVCVSVCRCLRFRGSVLVWRHKCSKSSAF